MVCVFVRVSFSGANILMIRPRSQRTTFDWLSALRQCCAPQVTCSACGVGIGRQTSQQTTAGSRVVCATRCNALLAYETAATGASSQCFILSYLFLVSTVTRPCSETLSGGVREYKSTPCKHRDVMQSGGALPFGSIDALSHLLVAVKRR
jgi:hypothetical protein